MRIPPRGSHALDPVAALQSLEETPPLRPIDETSDAHEDVLRHYLIGRILQDPPWGEEVKRGGWSDFADPRWAHEIHEYYCTLPERNSNPPGNPRRRVR
jgi:hypothetical protein